MPKVWVEPYKTKRWTIYRVRIEHDDGRREAYPEKFTYKSTANKKAQEIYDKLSGGKQIQGPHLIKECMQQFLNHRKSLIGKTIEASTYRIDETSLRPFLAKFGGKKDIEVTQTDLEIFKNELIVNRKPAGVNQVIRNMWKFFNFCVKNGHIGQSPAKEIEEFDPEAIEEWRMLDKKELAHFLRSVSDRMKHMRRAIYVLYNTGMRSGEFLKMGWKDLKSDRLTITNKGETRTIPLVSPPFPKLLRKLIVKFIANPINRNTFYSGWETIADNAKMGRVRPHDMRHTWASNLVAAGWPDKMIMKMAGWKSSAMLRKYTHFKDDFVSKMPRFKIR